MKTVEERFWSKVEKGAECWVWVGARDKRDGKWAGFFSAHGENLAHRVAWRLAGRDAPPGTVLTLECGTRYCVRPEHMKCDRRRWDSPNCDHRFWRHALKSESGCWLWMGQRNRRRNGYGRLMVHGRHMQAHRRAWELTNGSIPDGLVVCHRCDNPPCVRPDHLFLGTQAENIADAIAKGRDRIKGERNAQAILTAEHVRFIRQSGLTQTELARMFGVTQSAIWLVVHRRKWQSVAD